MPSPLRLGFTLMVVCVVAAGLLAFTNAATAPIIDANEQAKLQAALKELLPGADSFELLSAELADYYVGKKGGSDQGVVALFTHRGFGGEMQLVLGLDVHGRLTGLKVLQHSETPGLGARVAETEFLSQFAAKAAGDEFVTGHDVQGVSGATISSEAVAEAVREAVADIRERQLLPLGWWD